MRAMRLALGAVMLAIVWAPYALAEDSHWQAPAKRGRGATPFAGERGKGRNTRMTPTTWFAGKVTQMRSSTGNRSEQSKERALWRHMKRGLALRANDQPRAILVMWHQSHEHEEFGKRQIRQCEAYDDEVFARWSLLFHRVVVDVPASDPDLLKQLGVTDGPGLTILDPQLRTVATLDSFKNAKQAARFLSKTVKTEFGDYWIEVEDEMDRQKTAYAAAVKLVKEDKYQEAANTLATIYSSGVRLGKDWDGATKLYANVLGKLDRQKKK